MVPRAIRYIALKILHTIFRNNEARNWKIGSPLEPRFTAPGSRE